MEVTTKQGSREMGYAGMHRKRRSWSLRRDGAQENASVEGKIIPHEDSYYTAKISASSTSLGPSIGRFDSSFATLETDCIDNRFSTFDDVDSENEPKDNLTFTNKVPDHEFENSVQQLDCKMKDLPWRRPPSPIPRGWLELHVLGHGVQDPSKAGFGEAPPPPPMALTVNGGGFKPLFGGSPFHDDGAVARGGDGARTSVRDANVRCASERVMKANLAADRARATPRGLARSARTTEAFPKSPYSDKLHLNNRLWGHWRHGRRDHTAKGGTLGLDSIDMSFQSGDCYERAKASASFGFRGVMGSVYDNGNRSRGASVANIYSPRRSTVSESRCDGRLMILAES